MRRASALQKYGAASKQFVVLHPRRGHRSTIASAMASPAELGTLLLSEILAHHTTHRICESNPASLEVAAAILGVSIRTASYTAIPYHEFPMRPPWPKEQPPIRVLHPSSRSIRLTVGGFIGVCDTIIVRADAELTGLQASIARDLPLLMQHAAPHALIAMHGTRCTNGSALYRGPFWAGMLSVPCWQDKFDALVAAGTLTGAQCRTLGSHRSSTSASFMNGSSNANNSSSPSADGDGDAGIGTDVNGEIRAAVIGEYLLCTAVFRASASACATQEPLLERWSRESGAGCVVRKEPVTLKAATNDWTRSRMARQSLSHMFRRHMRYYSTFDCNGQVCLTFKNEVDEDWIAGLNSSDGLSFRGDPELVMPKLAVRSQLLNVLRKIDRGPLLSRSRQQTATKQREQPWMLRSEENAAHNVDARVPECGMAYAPAVGRAFCRGGPFGRSFELMLSGMTNNMAMVMHKGEWIAIGGRHNTFVDEVGLATSQVAKSRNGSVFPVPGWWKSTVQELREELPDWPNEPPATSLFSFARARPWSTASSDVTEAMNDVLARANMRYLEVLRPDQIPRRGLWLMSSPSWKYNDSPRPWLNGNGATDELARSNWHGKRLILDGRHPGCIERRMNTSLDLSHVMPGVCEFDGRLSLVSFSGELLLFSRANLAARGSRHVQVTRSSDDGQTWSPFEQVQLEGYTTATDGGKGDVYFFAVQVNPAHGGSLIAVFPLVHRMRGCIAMATSLDGVRWSRVTPLLSCSIYGERTLDQPASPALVRRGGEVWLYMHEEVPGITIDKMAPRLVYSHLVKAEKGSSVVRYAFPCAKLAEWTAEALLSWKDTDPLSVPRSKKRPTLYSCPPPEPPREIKSKDACHWSARALDTSHDRVPQPQPPPKRPYRVKLHLKAKNVQAHAAAPAALSQGAAKIRSVSPAGRQQSVGRDHRSPYIRL